MLHITARRTKNKKPRVQACILSTTMNHQYNLIPICEARLNSKLIQIHGLYNQPQMDRLSFDNFITASLPFPLNQLNLQVQDLFFILQDPMNKTQSQKFWKKFMHNPQSAQITDFCLVEP
jgi:hypothetical protein